MNFKVKNAKTPTTDADQKLNNNAQKDSAQKGNTQNDFQMSFTWDNTKQNVQGKALKRKKPSSNNSVQQMKTSNIAEQNSFNNNNSNNKNNEIGFNKHIKRKQRKDKILAKQLMKEGKQNTTSKPTIHDSNHQSHSLFSEKQKEIYVGTSTGKSVSENVFAGSGNSFRDVGIHRHLISNLEKINFTALTNVQEKAIPIILSGKDALIRSQTGSGKTLAYAVPIIDALLNIEPRITRTDGVQAIIVVPTRELALQTHELFGKINTFQWIIVGHLCGGENRKSEKDRLRKGIHVLIGTPGRLLDHFLHTSSLKLDKVRCLVLDEADRLLDMGFRKDILSLVEELDKARTNSEYDPISLVKKSRNLETDEKDSDEELPTLRNVHSKSRQTILLSATLTKAVSELANFTMKNETFVDALDDENDTSSIETSDYFVIPNTVKQEFLVTYVKHRLFTLSALIVAKSKQNSKLFVFMASMQMVDFHYELFKECLIKMPKNRGKLKGTYENHGGEKVVVFEDDSEDSDQEEEIVLDTEFFKLHGSMDQKTRKEVFTAFRNAKKGVLLCTDVAARGIDIPEADCIIQYTAPQTDQDYLHRVGRTGRAGKSGSAIIFLTHEEQDYVSHLKEHKVFLQKRDPEMYLNHLCDLMNEPKFEEAATTLQRHYESAVAKNKSLQQSACFAYSTWSRYYNSYPAKLRSIFNFKNVNLGHYVTSFALHITPTEVSQIVRGQVTNIEYPRLNKKLANHEEETSTSQTQNKKRKPLNSMTSEFSSGLKPFKKKKKKSS